MPEVAMREYLELFIWNIKSPILDTGIKDRNSFIFLFPLLAHTVTHICLPFKIK